MTLVFYLISLKLPVGLSSVIPNGNSLIKASFIRLPTFHSPFSPCTHLSFLHSGCFWLISNLDMSGSMGVKNDMWSFTSKLVFSYFLIVVSEKYLILNHLSQKPRYSSEFCICSVSITNGLAFNWAKSIASYLVSLPAVSLSLRPPTPLSSLHRGNVIWWWHLSSPSPL